MTYQEWFEDHGKKTNAIIQKLREKKYHQKQIIEYFRYETLSLQEPSFCPLFASKSKCHDIKELNCLFCGCPYLQFDTNSSRCSIDSKDGRQITTDDGATHQDCSSCSVPHREKFILSKFDYDWFRVMRECNQVQIK
jgi:Zn-finger protein